MPAGILQSGVRQTLVPSGQKYLLGVAPWFNFDMPAFEFTASCVQTSMTLDAVQPAFEFTAETASGEIGSLDITFKKFTTPFVCESGEVLSLAAVFPSFSDVSFACLAGGVGSLPVEFEKFDVAFRSASGAVATLAVEFDHFTSNATVLEYGTASLTAAFPSFEPTFASLTGSTASLAVEFESFTPAFTALAGGTASLSVEQPLFVATLTFNRDASLQPVFPAFTPVFRIDPAVSMTLAAELPLFIPSDFVIFAPQGDVVATSDYAVWVVNTDNGAHSTYTNWQANSHGTFNGKEFIALPDGIYELTGEEDGTEPIDAKVYWAPTDLGNPKQKRVDAAYVNGRFDGTFAFVAITDEAEKRIYVQDLTLHPYSVHRKRVLLTRALQGRYWQFGFENRNGNDFALDTIELTPVPLSRKLK